MSNNFIYDRLIRYGTNWPLTVFEPGDIVHPSFGSYMKILLNVQDVVQSLEVKRHGTLGLVIGTMLDDDGHNHILLWEGMTVLASENDLLPAT